MSDYSTKFPFMFQYAPNKWFNMKKLVAITSNEDNPTNYLYQFEGPVLLNIPKEAHENFMSFIIDFQ